MANKYEFYKLRGEGEVYTFSPRGEMVLVSRQGPDGVVRSTTMVTRIARGLWSDLKKMGLQADSLQPGGVS